MLSMSKEEKKILIDFLQSLTIKITYDSPQIADLIIADQLMKSHKDKKYHYTPLQIVMFLFIKENNQDESEENSLNLRKIILLILKQATKNPKIKDYVLSESELPLILIAKLALYYSYLPESLM